jgi:hypothetical protein
MLAAQVIGHSGGAFTTFREGPAMRSIMPPGGDWHKGAALVLLVFLKVLLLLVVFWFIINRGHDVCTTAVAVAPVK